MAPVTEGDLRCVVKSTVVEVDASSLVVDEFVVSERGRIDIALIGDHFQGYELKSDLDTLTRLPRQMEVYGQVFDFCTLVVTPRHLARARQVLKPGWGLALVTRDRDDSLSYRQVRRARKNKTVMKQSLAALLWRDEVLRSLDALDAAAGLRSRSRDELCDALAAICEIDQLRRIVIDQITARQGWRDVQAPHAHAVRSPHADVSSGFLARRLRSLYR